MSANYMTAMSKRQQKTMTSTASTNSGCENVFHYIVEQSAVYILNYDAYFDDITEINKKIENIFNIFLFFFIISYLNQIFIKQKIFLVNQKFCYLDIYLLKIFSENRCLT